MKIIKKMVWLIVIITIFFAIFANISNATTKDPIENPDAYKPTGNLASDGGKLISKGNLIIAAFQVLGTITAVVALMVIGLRYMLGSTEERANYKETMLPYLIGAIMVFTIPNLLRILYDLVSSVKF